MPPRTKEELAFLQDCRVAAARRELEAANRKDGLPVPPPSPKYKNYDQPKTGLLRPAASEAKVSFRALLSTRIQHYTDQSLQVSKKRSRSPPKPKRRLMQGTRTDLQPRNEEAKKASTSKVRWLSLLTKDCRILIEVLQMPVHRDGPAAPSLKRKAEDDGDAPEAKKPV